jgi:cytochrome c peroxidase
MRRLTATLALVAGVAACASDPRRADGTIAEGPRWRGDARAEITRALVLARLDTLDAALDTLTRAATAHAAGSATLDAVRDRFIAARGRWKLVEFLVEAYTPTSARQLNGPPLPDIEVTEGHRPVREPEGFQVVEGLLWTDAPRADGRAVAAEVATMRQTLERVRQILVANVLVDGTLWDAGRQALARVATLGLGGFDSAIAQRHLVELRIALRGLRDGISPYAADARRHAPDAWRALDAAFDRTDAALARDSIAATADHFALLADHLLPLARAFHALAAPLAITIPAERRPWRLTAATPFDRDAWDVMAWAPQGAPAPTAALVDLGEALAHSPLLSRDGTRACTTCHVPALGFADARPTRAGLAPDTTAPRRNTPTLLNAALQPALFADQRVAYLEDQVADVIANPAEMHGDVDHAATRLAADPAVRVRFARAFGDGASTATPAVTGQRIRQAIAAWERSLVRLESPFDRALRGDTAALAPLARRGFAVFMGTGKCGTCHFAPLFGGTLPPGYTKAEFEVLGTPARPVWRGARLDGDAGRGRLTGEATHAGAFKTPGLRNVALTAPYMHNGVYRTLDEVLEFYVRGGGAGIGLDLPHQTLPPDRVQLTAQDRQALVAFLEALTDTSGIRVVPRAPLPAPVNMAGASAAAFREAAAASPRPPASAPGVAAPTGSRRWATR